MATYRKIKKRNTRKLSLKGFTIILVSLAIFAYLASSIFVSSITNSLTMDIQNMTNEISNLKNENQSLNIEIQSLQDKERVYLIAQESGMNQNQDNIVSVVVED